MLFILSLSLTHFSLIELKPSSKFQCSVKEELQFFHDIQSRPSYGITYSYLHRPGRHSTSSLCILIFLFSLKNRRPFFKYLKRSTAKKLGVFVIVTKLCKLCCGTKTEM